MEHIFVRGRGRRLPLPDELPYRFFPPRVSPLWHRVSRLYIRRVLNRKLAIRSIEFDGVERLSARIGRGDGVLIAPNHCDHADCVVAFELSRKVSKPFCYMAAYQIFFDFFGFRKFILPRLGVFPVDREGSDRLAYKAGLDILVEGKNPLVIFPEGEIYHLADRLTPLREGASALAISAAKKKSADGTTVWVVPAAIKYRYVDDHDPLPALIELMSDLEGFFTWTDQSNKPLLDRMYRYAEMMLSLKEYEYLDGVRSGPLKDRIADLTSRLLSEIEDRRLGKRSLESTPVRVKELRRACLKAIDDPATTIDQKRELRRDFDALFLCIQMFSYPGDYVRESPTVERLGEILSKFEMDILGVEMSAPRGPRRAIMKLGEPIDVRGYLGSTEARPRSRDATARLTTELEARIQGLLDEIGPGRPLPRQAIENGSPIPGAMGGAVSVSV